MRTTTRTTLQLSAARTALAVLMAVAMCAPAAAQDACEDDAGDACEDDGGVTTPPAVVDAGALPDAGQGGFDAGGEGEGPGTACSCETDTNPARSGRIHVCTESFEDDVCEAFECERGTERARGCPAEAVALCCTMPGRGLSAYLYEDCTHANCASGFRAQCDEFGGTISVGACETDHDAIGDSDDSGGACSVSLGRGSARNQRGLAWAAAALLLARRRRTRG